MVRRFGIVQVQPKSVGWLSERVLREQGLTDRCTGIRHVAGDDEMELVHAAMLERSVEPKAEMTKRISDEISAAASEDGAEAIILGCMCMTGVADELARRSPVPIVSPLHAAFQSAEQLARLNLPTGTAAEAPDRGNLRAIYERAAEQFSAAPALGANEAEECVVCAAIYTEDDEKQPAGV